AVGARPGAALALRSLEHRALRGDPPRRLQGPAARDPGAHRARVGRHHGGRRGRRREALGVRADLRGDPLGDAPDRGVTMRHRPALVAGLVLLLLAVVPALADMTPAPPKSRMPPAPSAEGEYARGVAATKSKEWSVAEAAFGRAVEMKADYAEAWNGLG